MKPPLVHKAARIRLAEIWDYTFGIWGEEQADRYLRGLATCVDGLGARRHQWRGVRDVRLPGVFFVRSGHHFVFFREIQERIAIISVLHENMDIVRRLKEDMEMEE